MFIRKCLFYFLFFASVTYGFNQHEQLLINGVAYGNANDLIAALQYCSKTGIDLPFKLTQTGIHLKNNLYGLTNYVVGTYTANKELMRMASEVIEKEREYQKKGYYTFVHGQKRGYLFPEKMYTFLWQQKKGIQVEDFLFLHVKPLLETKKEQDEEEKMRQYLLKYGRKPQDGPMRQKLLFLNYALFGNLNDSSSSTANYVASNVNYGSQPISVTTKDAFALLDYQNIYKKYQTEIEALEKDYAVSNYGTFIVVAVPKQDIAKYVYLCSSGSSGWGMGGVKRSIFIKGIGKVDDISIIMDAIMNNPSSLDTDDLEFCLIMTQHEGGLDPKTGIKIEAIIAGDPNVNAQLAKKEKALCDRIRADIQAQS
ncbi:MAG: hypothetical protein AMXMBFR12_03280 [Candidatus Babeliales bacterium]